MCNLTTQVSVKVHIGVVLHAGLHGAGKLLLLHLAVEGAVCPIGEGGHAGLHAAAGAPGVRPPPFVHRQQPRLRPPAWDSTKERERESTTKHYKEVELFFDVPFIISGPACTFFFISLRYCSHLYEWIQRENTSHSFIYFQWKLCTSCTYNNNLRVSHYSENVLFLKEKISKKKKNTSYSFKQRIEMQKIRKIIRK